MFSRFLVVIAVCAALFNRVQCVVDPVVFADIIGKLSALALSPDVVDTLDTATKLASSTLNDGILNAYSLFASNTFADPEQLSSAFGGLSSSFISVGEALSKDAIEASQRAGENIASLLSSVASGLPEKLQTTVNADDFLSPTGKQLFSNINNYFTSDPLIQKLKSMSASEFTSDLINNQIAPSINKQFSPALDAANKLIEDNSKVKTAEVFDLFVKPKLDAAVDASGKAAASYSDSLVKEFESTAAKASTWRLFPEGVVEKQLQGIQQAIQTNPDRVAAAASGVGSQIANKLSSSLSSTLNSLLSTATSTVDSLTAVINTAAGQSLASTSSTSSSALPQSAAAVGGFTFPSVAFPEINIPKVQIDPAELVQSTGSAVSRASVSFAEQLSAQGVKLSNNLAAFTERLNGGLTRISDNIAIAPDVTADLLAKAKNEVLPSLVDQTKTAIDATSDAAAALAQKLEDLKKLDLDSYIQPVIAKAKVVTEQTVADASKTLSQRAQQTLDEASQWRFFPKDSSADLAIRNTVESTSTLLLEVKKLVDTDGVKAVKELSEYSKSLINEGDL